MLTVTRTFAECSPTTLNRTFDHSLLLLRDGNGGIIRDFVTIV